jgi:two-component system, OmpR family, phosphate regulon sensor histidine kinase PhoR
MRAGLRLFLSYLTLIVLVVAVLAVGADRQLRAILTDTTATDLQREAMLAAALYDESPDVPPEVMADRITSIVGLRTTIIARDGRVLGESDVEELAAADIENHAARPEVRAALAGEVGVATRVSATVDVRLLYVAVPSARGEIVRLGMPLAMIDAAVRRVQRAILGVGVVALVIAGMLSVGFSIAITRPLRRIAGTAHAMAGGALDRRTGNRRRDELGEVARALDTLAEELQRRLGQLEEERAEMQTLIDSMAEGVIAFDAEGTVRRANPAARTVFSLGSARGGMPLETVSRRREFIELVTAVRDGGAVGAVEMTQGDRQLIVTGQPLPEGGGVLVVLDVSELRRLEGVRRDFVANASHELKTPLTAIQGYAETLAEEGTPEELRAQFAETIRVNAARLRRIVDDLLDLSRIESGGWKVHPEAVSIERLAREAWAGFADRAAERGIRFEVHTEGDADLVTADPGALRQVFSNLFSNALRYTEEGGEIGVRISERAGDGVRRVSVRDTGSGIPAAHLPRIFERFYRVDPARSRAEGGTGLGLAIVRHLVEAHGGSVGAESELGRGTTITFTLPV